MTCPECRRGGRQVRGLCKSCYEHERRAGAYRAATLNAKLTRYLQARLGVAGEARAALHVRTVAAGRMYPDRAA